jgi:hypothetical protein
MQAEVKQCQNCNHDFTIESEDFAFYEKINVPAPTFCPECRLIRRLVWRNERSLYKRNCDLCKKSIVSMYDKDVEFPVYCPTCWRSDNWNPEDYAQDYNFDQNFFSQYKDLLYKVPRPASLIHDSQEVDFASIVYWSKDVYLSSSILKSEHIFYCKNIDAAKNLFDSINIKDSENGYENIDSYKNYNCRFIYYSEGCIDSMFLQDCANCQNCFGCVNLRNKQYCIWNEQYSKEEYQEKIIELNLGSYKNLQKAIAQFQEFIIRFPKKYARIVNSINSTGDNLENCKNVHHSFYSYDAEDSKYLYRCPGVKDNMDSVHAGWNEFVYEFINGGAMNSSHVYFMTNAYVALSNIQYSDNLNACSNCFGCVGLKNKEYFIFNKQYSKEEYEGLIEKIKQHMHDTPYTDSNGRTYAYGEFFPAELSVSAYNETIAQEYFPLNKEDALQKGFLWKDKDEKQFNVTLKAEDIPDHINDIQDSILQEVIECARSNKAFRLTAAELQFYRQFSLPIPRLHPDERYKERIKYQNPLELWKRTTDDGLEVLTAYAPDRPERILSEEAYKREVL